MSLPPSASASGWTYLDFGEVQEHETTAQTHHSLVSPRSQKGDFPPAELTFAQVWEILYDGTKPPGDPWGEEGTEDRDVICDVDAAVDLSGASRMSSLLSQRETGTLVTQKDLVLSSAWGTWSWASNLN